MDEVQRHIANTKAMVEGASRHARWFNLLNGMLLIVTGPFNIILSAITLKLGDLMTSVYLSMFGVLLVAMEIPLGSLQQPLREYFKFLYTRFGRATFLVLVSNLAMVCGKVGFITAALTILNAGLNLYLLGQNQGDARKEADLLQNTMAQVTDEMSSQMKSTLAPLRFLGVSAGLPRLWPFGRRRPPPVGAAQDEAFSSFENPFSSELDDREAPPRSDGPAPRGKGDGGPGEPGFGSSYGHRPTGPYGSEQQWRPDGPGAAPYDGQVRGGRREVDARCPGPSCRPPRFRTGPPHASPQPGGNASSPPRPLWQTPRPSRRGAA